MSLVNGSKAGWIEGNLPTAGRTIASVCVVLAKMRGNTGRSPSLLIVQNRRPWFARRDSL